MDVDKMTYDDIENRLSEIKSEMETDGADFDALSGEVDALNERMATIKLEAAEAAEKRAKVASGTGEVIAERKQENTMDDKIYNAMSPEYRTAWLKNMAVLGDHRLFGELTEVENRAYTMTTANTGAVVPTETMNRIVELVKSMSPLYDDATKSGLTKGFGVPRHSAIAAGDAAATNEGVANADENDTFTLLSIPGVEIKKHVVISRKMAWQSIDSFETWLTQHIAKRIAVAKEAQIITRLNATATGIASANILTPTGYTDANIRAALAKITEDGQKVFYANNATIYNGLAGIQDTTHRPLFINSTVSDDPAVVGRIYGAPVKVDNNLSDNVIYVGVPASILANDFETLYLQKNIDPKTFETIIAGYSLFDAGLENPTAFVKMTVTVSG